MGDVIFHLTAQASSTNGLVNVGEAAPKHERLTVGCSSTEPTDRVSAVFRSEASGFASTAGRTTVPTTHVGGSSSTTSDSDRPLETPTALTTDARVPTITTVGTTRVRRVGALTSEHRYGVNDWEPHKIKVKDKHKVSYTSACPYATSTVDTVVAGDISVCPFRTSAEVRTEILYKGGNVTTVMSTKTGGWRL